MTINWSALEAKMVAMVERVLTKSLHQHEERWVTADELSKHVGTLTTRFLQDHGQMFNRTRVEWTDKEGNRHSQAWLYPLHEIQAMLADGRIKELRMTS